jgi:L-iditol 2-dehydrogenase
LGELQLRDPLPQETLLKVAATGLCGSDLHYYKDGGIGSAIIKTPFVPGHEFGAWLTEDIPEMGLKRGDLVAVDPNVACGQCEHCHLGYTNLCTYVKFIGAPGNPGAMTQYIWAPKHKLYALPAHFSALDAAMLEPLGVAIHAVDLARPKLHERVVVLGCGTIGLLIVQLLAPSAAEVVVVEPQERRRELALRLGASNAYADWHAVQKHGDGKGFPLVIEATNAPEGMHDAIMVARVGGRVVLVGIPDGGEYPALAAAEPRRRALTIRFSRRAPEVYPRAIALLASRRVDVQSIVTHRFDLAQTPQAFEQMAQGNPDYVKTIVYPNGF